MARTLKTLLPLVAKIEKHLNDEMAKEPIRIKGLLKKRKEPLKEFLIKFFSDWNFNKETILKMTGDIQTTTSRRRSITDLYKICKYYYPKVTLIQVYKTMIEEVREEVPNMRTSFCHTIKRRVFYQGTSTQGAGVFDEGTADEFGMLYGEWETVCGNSD